MYMMPDHRQLSILGIIVVCGLVFVYEQTDLMAITQAYGAVPEIIVAAWGSLVEGNHVAAAVRTLARLMTAIFLHGDFEHILYNMVFLWVFGTLVSQELGQWWALAFFFVCGIAGNIAQVLLNQGSNVPIIGASGAITGFQGLYLGLALRWQLPSPDVWPLAYPIPPLQLAAFAVLGFMFDAYALMNHHQEIAYGAHVGGFVSGLVIAAAVTILYPTDRAFQRRSASRVR